METTRRLGQLARVALRTHYTGSYITSKNRMVASQSDAIEFNQMFPDIIRELTDNGQRMDLPKTNRRFAQVLQYNMAGGKKNRGLAVLVSFKKLVPEEKQTPEILHRVRILGWCLEMMHTSLVMSQDTLSGRGHRRGRLSWHKAVTLEPAAGAACTDAATIHSAVYGLLRLHFRDLPCYTAILELFNDIYHKSLLGQFLELKTRSDKSLSLFTMDQYRAIAKYKNAYYSWHMPISLALHMAGINDQEIHRQAKMILIEMGIFYKVLDDYLDCFGDESILGRQGTDIADGRCTWLSVVALQRARPAQTKVMQESYGSTDPNKVAAIKELYLELSLPSTYKIYEEQSYDLLCTQIQQISRGLPHALFFHFLDNIYVKEQVTHTYANTNP